MGIKGDLTGGKILFEDIEDLLEACGDDFRVSRPESDCCIISIHDEDGYVVGDSSRQDSRDKIGDP